MCRERSLCRVFSCRGDCGCSCGLQLVEIVFEGTQAVHNVRVGLHHPQDVARIRKLGCYTSRLLDAAAHARHRVRQRLALHCKRHAVPCTRLLDLAHELCLALCRARLPRILPRS